MSSQKLVATLKEQPNDECRNGCADKLQDKAAALVQSDGDGGPCDVRSDEQRKHREKEAPIPSPMSVK